MKRILKKNQIIVTALAILIAVAGYLKYTSENGSISGDLQVANNDVYEEVYEGDTLLEGKSDIESQDEPEETTLEPGAAVLTNQGTFTDYIVQARLDREQMRSQNIEQLQKIIDNSELSESEKEIAVNSMVKLNNNIELENNITELLNAKGYENILVTISDNQVDVIIPDSELNNNAKTQIENVVKRKTGLEAENITITPAKE